MPTKIKKDEVIVKRSADGTQSKTRKKHFMKNYTNDYLIRMLNEEKTTPKLKQKIRNFLTGIRGVKLTRVKR